MTSPSSLLRPPAPHLSWAKGGHAEICKLVDDAIEVRSTTPAPPGALLVATLTDASDASRTVVKMKSYGSRREADGAFFMKGRLIEATRELRERLRLYTAPPPLTE